MAADGGADIVDLHLAVELGEAGLHQVRHLAGVPEARGVADIALAVVIQAVSCALLHLVHNGLNDLFLGADLVAGDQPAQIVHIQQRADIQHAAEEGRGLGDSAALYIKAQVGGEEPVVQLQPVLLNPFCQLFRAQSLVPLVGSPVHQQAVAGGGAQRVDHIDIPLGKAFLDDKRRVPCRVDRAGQAGGQAHMDNILALLQEGGKVVHIFADAHLSGAGVRALAHRIVKLGKRHALTQIVGVFLPIQEVVEADIMNVPAFKMLVGQVCSGAAAQNIVTHKGSSFLFKLNRFYGGGSKISNYLPIIRSTVKEKSR